MGDECQTKFGKVAYFFLWEKLLSISIRLRINNQRRQKPCTFFTLRFVIR